MNDEEKEKLIRLAAQNLSVLCAFCRHCRQEFYYISESADTDMVSCFCGSVYSVKNKRLVIAPLTADEIYKGAAKRLDTRINRIAASNEYQYCGNMICPHCGEKMIAKTKKEISLTKYCALHPNTLMIYPDETIKVLSIILIKPL